MRGPGSRQAHFLQEKSLPSTSGKRNGSAIARCTLTPVKHPAVTTDSLSFPGDAAGLLGVSIPDVQVCLSGHMSTARQGAQLEPQPAGRGKEGVQPRLDHLN